MASAEKLFARARKAHLSGDAAHAMRLYRDVLKASPRHLDAWYLLGTLQATRGELAIAAATLQKAADIDPKSAMVLTNLGLVLKMLGRSEQAESVFRRALSIDPHLPQAANNLAALLIDRGLPAEAEGYARRAANTGPDAAVYALIQLANAQADQGNATAALSTLQSMLQIAPEHRIGWGNFLSFLHYDPAKTREQILELHCQWGHRLSTSQSPEPFSRSGGKLRIGYISPDFLAHPVGQLIEPVIAQHDAQRVEVFLYHDTAQSDALTERLRALSHIAWRVIAGLSDAALAAQLRADRIDVLVELAGHLSGNRLSALAMRAAPVQVTYLGYPGSTGLSAIDYAISDVLFDPPDEGNKWYTESLYRLDRPMFCYAPPIDAPEIVATPPIRPFRFGAFNTLRKLNDEVISHWARILVQVPEAVLVMQAKGLGDEAVRRALGERFAVHGVDARRLEFHSFGSFAEHMRLVSGTHLCLDPWPWNGHMTTLHCLWAGVPVITMEGDRRATRMGKCILSAIGLDEFVANSPAGYVDLALARAAAPAKLQELRDSLRKRITNSALSDAKGLASALEEAYFKMQVASRS